MNEVPALAPAPAEPPGLTLPATVCRRLAHDLPRAAGPEAALAIVEGVRQELLGDGLLTVNLNVTPADAAPDVVELQRAWSSRPVHYPVAGRKRKMLTAWTRQLLQRAEVFVGEGDDALAAVFDDAQRIRSMGLHAVVNVPLVEPGGRCFATFNVLGGNGAWTAQERLLVELLAALALPAVRGFAERSREAGTMPR
ncbi:GAF domain-containing protein (plasmid) [Comamonadaceae bacterium OTU4NAUVB1]|nr:GAF domain-containing protein [Comamonadaceae bacterium OTU4NAUVB1]